MLKIGDFSKLSYISIRMLRYYDKENILKPSYIDKNNNYRFYNVEQLEEANIIQKLKSLGFLKKVIKEILQKRDTETVNEYFDDRINEIKNELNNMIKASKEIDLLVQGGFDDISYNVVKKTIPKRKVISLRKIISNYMSESILWKELFKEIANQKISISNECYPVAIYHDLEYKDKNVDIEVQVSVDKFYQDTDLISFYEIPSIEVASVIFNGSYEKMIDVTRSVGIWMELNDYELVQPTFNIFHISPTQDKNPNNWITEACFPIKERRK